MASLKAQRLSPRRFAQSALRPPRIFEFSPLAYRQSAKGCQCLQRPEL